MLPTIAPFGIDDPDAYLMGYQDRDSSLLNVLPRVPDYKQITTDKKYFIAASGSDGDAGTMIAPFATIFKAIQQSQIDKAITPGFYFKSGDTFNVSAAMPRGWKGLFRCYGDGALPIIQSNVASPFWFGASDTIQFFGLHFKTAVNVEAGIVGNGLSNLWVDSCEFEGFNFAVELTGSGNFNPKIYRCNIHDQKPDPNSLNHCSGIYIQGANTWDIQGNAIERCGLIDINPNDPTAVAVANQRHGVYINESSLTGNGIFRLNLVLDSAGSGIGSRLGGDFSYNVFRGGGDFHLIAQGDSSTILGNAFFGPLVDAPPNWGGGICVISDHSLVEGNWFAGNAKTTNNSWLTVKAGNCVARQNRGFWTKPVPAVISPPTLRPNIAIAPASALTEYNNTVSVSPGAVPTLTPFSLAVVGAVVPMILDWMNRSFR